MYLFTITMKLQFNRSSRFVFIQTHSRYKCKCFFGLFSTPHISSLWSTVTSIFPIDVKLFIDCENGTEQHCFVNITWCDVSCVILAPHSCELNLIYHVTHLNSTNLQKRQRERTFQLFNHSTTFKASISFVSVIHHNIILRIVYYFKVSAFIS